MLQTAHVTPRAAEVLRAMYLFQKETGYMPTLRELAARTNIAATSNVAYHLDHLVDAGMLTVRTSAHAGNIHGPRLPRTWQLTDQGMARVA